jgi:large subunit ribosomal protein L9
MKVILKKDIKGTGKVGDLVNVSDGHARNYLIPRGMAIEADAKALNELKNAKASEAHKQEMHKQEAQAVCDKIEGQIISLHAKAGQGGRLFGSVTAKEIAEELKAKYGVAVDKKKITLDADIKAFGTYEAQVKLHPQITAKFRVQVSEAQ